uniref:Uncharacterized protein n=1 Tax=Romanomermis culicivorax TaxID=13658 RepID=A0A915IZI8_ROMCU
MSPDTIVSLIFLVGRVVQYVALIRLTLEPAEVFTRNGIGIVGKRLEMIITADHIACPFTQNRTLTSIVWPFSWSTDHFHQVKNEPDNFDHELLLPVGSVINDALKSYADCARVLANLSDDDRIHDMEHSRFVILREFHSRRIEHYQNRTNDREKFIRSRLTYSLVASLIWTLMTSSCLAFRLSWPYEYSTRNSLVDQKYFDIPFSWTIAIGVALSISVCYALEVGFLQCLNSGGFGEDSVSNELKVCNVRGETADWCCCRRSGTTLRETDDIFPSKCAHHAKCLEEERLRKGLVEKEAFDRRSADK